MKNYEDKIYFLGDNEPGQTLTGHTENTGK